MKCERCGSGCPPSDDGLCFHCKVATWIDKETGGKISDGTIAEGFPDWHKPTKEDKINPQQKKLL